MQVVLLLVLITCLSCTYKYVDCFSKLSPIFHVTRSGKYEPISSNIPYFCQRSTLIVKAGQEDLDFKFPEKEWNKTRTLSLGGITGFSAVSSAIFLLLVLYTGRRDLLRVADTNLFLAIHGYALYSASSRNRLDATTFRILTPTLFLPLLHKACGTFKALHQRSLLSVLDISWSCLTILATITALRGYQLPNPFTLIANNLKSKSLLSKLYLMLPVLFGFALNASTFHNIIWLQLAGTSLALSGAAAVGPKRLSSDTYQLLNKAFIASGFCNLLFLLRRFTHASPNWIFSIAVESLLLSLGYWGWKLGSDYKTSEKQQKG